MLISSNSLMNRGAVVGGLFLLAGAVNAAEYRVDSYLRVATQHDDNVNLSVSNQDSLYGETVNPAAKFQAKTEAWDTALKVDLRFSDFNRSGYDSDDQYIDWISGWQGEKSTFNLNAKAIHDTTRTSEGTDSGRYSNDRRNYYSLAPTWSYYISNRNIITLNASLSTVDYKSERYTGYDDVRLYAEWTYIVIENLKFFLRANSSDTEFDARTRDLLFINVNPLLSLPVEQTIANSSESFGFQLGLNYQFTEKLSLFGLFGQSDNKSWHTVTDEHDACALTEDNPSWTVRGACAGADQKEKTKNQNIDTKISWEEERQSFSAGYSIQTQPSSDGYILQFEQVTLDWKYKLSEKNTVSTNIIWGENKALDVRSNQLQARLSNRQFNTVNLKYAHKITENWQVSASLRYRYQDRESYSGDAEGTGGRLAIRYAPQTQQW